jgi:type I restriction enzyme S subunit
MKTSTSITLTPLKELVRSTQRGLSTPYLKNGTEPILLVKAKDITTDGDLSAETVDTEYVKRKSAFDRARLRPGDVLVTVAGSRFRAAVVPKDATDLIASNSLIALSFDQTRILPEFAVWYLNSSPGQADLQRWASGATMMSLNTTSLLEVAIPLPTLEEQQRLVELFRLVRTYREILDEETTLLNRLVDALMKDVNRK